LNHNSKQFAAWFFAFGLSGAIFGGGNYWLEHRLHAKSSHPSDTEHATAEHATAEHATAEHATAEHATAEHATAEHATAEHATAEHATAEHATAEHATAEHATAEHATGSVKASSAPSEKSPSAHDEHKSEWTYGKLDANGPANWGDLAQNFSVCEKGLEQSPIDIRQAKYSAQAPKISWHYGTAKIEIENNGHTIQSKLLGGDNHITVDGEKYTLAQFHFHSPSEHRLSGVPSDLELHFVHKNATGKLAVIGLMIDEKSGTENKNFKPIWDILPRDLHTKAAGSLDMKLVNLLPKDRDYFHYKGSLTTPPCSEGVRWFVLQEPLRMSSGQVEMYSSIFQGTTNRPVQPVNGRDILTNKPPLLAH